MKLSAALLVSVLVASAKSQIAYYLGDSLKVTLPSESDKYRIISAELSVPGFPIVLETPKGEMPKNISINETFPCNFGSSSAAMMNVAHLPLPAMANLTYKIKPLLKPEEMRSLPVGLVARHIDIMQRGKVLTPSTSKQSIDLKYIGSSPVNLSLASSWSVQLVTKGTNTFKPHKMMNVTKVTKNMNNMYTIMGDFQSVTPMADLFLLVGVNNGMNPFNIYSIPGNTMGNIMYEWVATEDMKVTAPTIEEYQVKKITVNPGSGLVQGKGYFWMLATDNNNSKKYAIGRSCAPLDLAGTKVSPFDFEWKVLPYQLTAQSSVSQNILPEGTFDLSLVYTKSSAAQTMYNAQNNPTSGTVGKLTITPHQSNSMTAVSFTVPGNPISYLGELKAKQNLTIVVTSIFKKTYVEWFKKGNNGVNVTNETAGWVPLNNVSMPLNFDTIGTNQSISLIVPELSNKTEQEYGLRLYGWGEDCAGERLRPTFAHGNWSSGGNSGGSGGGSSSKLGAGAIVGIVCAVVFVCGVAAWWLCMKNSTGQDRYQKLDH